MKGRQYTDARTAAGVVNVEWSKQHKLQSQRSQAQAGAALQCEASLVQQQDQG